MLRRISQSTQGLLGVESDRKTTVTEDCEIRSSIFCLMYAARALSIGSETDQWLNSSARFSFLACPRSKLTYVTSSYPKLRNIFRLPYCSPAMSSFLALSIRDWTLPI